MGGASYLKSLKAPFPFLRLVPTGGVTVQTAASFLEAGASALGVGADLVNTAAWADGKPEVITNAAKAYVDIIAAVRAKK
jgi:2-dehydro-3-deoxyphosphogluconate aldolase / (4S)-4-hydroxy-2-oxoglutarate aldolase